MLIQILYDGCVFSGNTHAEIIYQMKLLDWDEPKTNLEFKRNVSQRIRIFNKIILFHDAKSFLEALLNAEIIDMIHYSDSKEKKLDFS